MDIGNEILDVVDSVSVQYEGPCKESPDQVCEKSFELSYNPPISKVNPQIYCTYTVRSFDQNVSGLKE